MGLDMYAYRTSVQISKPVGFSNEVYPSDEKLSSQIMYWRKHPALHGWMENLYYEKGGTAEIFNCSPIELNLEDLDKLEEDIENKNLPHTEGFFFGESKETQVNEQDLEFLTAARCAIQEGDRVFYDSWW